MDVIDEIKKVKTGTRGYHDDVPVDDIVIKEITRD
jgi:peptidyl-prolyl cis-trans isomerase B (cyclophilin B)